ncbi:hypothetical protein AVDCRST_MAG81-2811 [uncultured Synechococcales cyanobacterium]|uniref:NADH:flavin oxidoreductases, Old Yellow Enzyme family n=1 Tax=uncultured Synechococcales cyanobacterium TaxID=1936017 RepID=A0A6J4VJ08_9CYAN|nr:hypothetical protein AVDCRST_MAG81-2811 [uncultured Synechococcales cyanobacterium]
MNTNTLLSPVKIDPYELRNWVVMVPLTRTRAGTGRMPSALMVEYDAQ